MTIQMPASDHDQAGERGLLLQLTVDSLQDLPRLIDLLKELSAVQSVTVISTRSNEELTSEGKSEAKSRTPGSQNRRQSGKRGSPGLTQREEEVLQLMSRGCPNRTIAAVLAISENTVRAHARSIMQKMKVSNRVQAAAIAVQSRLVTY